MARNYSEAAKKGWATRRARQGAKGASKSAKKGWATRRKRYGKSGRKKDAKEHRKRKEAAKKGVERRKKGKIDRAFKALEAVEGMLLTPELEELRRNVVELASELQITEERNQLVESALGMREQIAFVQDLWERDPDSLQASLREQIFEAYENDLHSVPQKIEELWIMVWGIWEIEDYEDIGELWDIYKGG